MLQRAVIQDLKIENNQLREENAQLRSVLVSMGVAVTYSHRLCTLLECGQKGDRPDNVSLSHVSKGLFQPPTSYG